MLSINNKLTLFCFCFFSCLPALSHPGLNLGRMLGDKFLKQQDARFSSEPYISPVVCIHQASRGFALLAR